MDKENMVLRRINSIVFWKTERDVIKSSEISQLHKDKYHVFFFSFVEVRGKENK
jgi:hypothetical protein